MSENQFDIFFSLSYGYNRMEEQLKLQSREKHIDEINGVLLLYFLGLFAHHIHCIFQSFPSLHQK